MKTYLKNLFRGKGFMCVLFMTLGGFLLWKNYSDQIFSALPYLVFLLCPIMHIFMHKGHGGPKGE